MCKNAAVISILGEKIERRLWKQVRYRETALHATRGSKKRFKNCIYKLLMKRTEIFDDHGNVSTIEKVCEIKYYIHKRQQNIQKDAH